MASTTDHGAVRLDFYRIAVELNNIGVCLLESKAHRSAIDTLKGSVEVMKQVVRPTYCHGESICCDQVVCYIITARRRLAHLERSGPIVASSILYSRGEGFQVKEETSDASEGEESSSPMTNPILIDASTETEGGNLNPDLESAILFHNLALAELQAVSSPANQRIFLQGALDLFEMAYSITLMDVDSLLELSLEDIHDLGATRVFLAIILVNNIIRVKESLGKHGEAHRSCRHLVRLELAVMNNQDQVMDEDYEEISFSAPAA